jgi:hypothetical protein
VTIGAISAEDFDLEPFQSLPLEEEAADDDDEGLGCVCEVDSLGREVCSSDFFLLNKPIG